MAHRAFLAFLFIVSITAVLAIGVHGFEFYTTPVAQRLFLTNYEEMKPSAVFSHGLGIVGSSMIILGVAMYSTRKRVRALWNLGRLSYWLEVHIFLCLLGPILVVFHTTFKAGGIAAVSLWCMLSVAASGVIGRFLYIQIPRNLKGAELTEQEVSSELDRLAAQLETTPLGKRLIDDMDKQFAAYKTPRTLGETMRLLLRLNAVRRTVRHAIRRAIAHSGMPREQARAMFQLASARTSLKQKTFLLVQMERLFFYWHALHLPFTIIMFITLAAHVVVTMMLGYRWVF